MIQKMDVYWAYHATPSNKQFCQMFQNGLIFEAQLENELAPRVLRLSRDAKEKWISFHDEIDGSLKPDGIFRVIRRTANKAAEQVLRIAGVLTLIDNITADEIPVDILDRAVQLIRYYLNEAIRINEIGAIDADLVEYWRIFGEWRLEKGGKSK